MPYYSHGINGDADDEGTKIMARNTRAKITDDVAAGSCTFDFADGGDVLVVKLSELPKNIQRQLAVSRLHNKLMDTYADTSTNPRHQVMGALEILKRGEWSERGEAAPQQSLLADAIVMVAAEAGRTINRDQTIEKLDGMTKDQRAALRKDAKVAAALGRIEAKRKLERSKKLDEAASGSTGSIIDQLLGGESTGA